MKKKKEGYGTMVSQAETWEKERKGTSWVWNTSQLSTKTYGMVLLE